MATDVLPFTTSKASPEPSAVETPSPSATLLSMPAVMSAPALDDFNPAAAEVRAILDIQIFEQSRVAESQRPRQWTPEARAASQFLANAMEYLADSRELPTGRFTLLMEQTAESEAILILMDAKRQIVQSLPLVERRRSGLFSAWKGFERRRDRQH